MASTRSSSSRLAVLVRPKRGEDGQFGAGGIIRIRGDRQALDEVLESQAGDLGAAAAARGEGEEQEGRVTTVGEPSAVARGDEPLDHHTGQGFHALASARPPGGADGEAERSAQVRRRKRALEAELATEGHHRASRLCTVEGVRTAARSRPSWRSAASTASGMPCEGSPARRTGS
jgi:hypothetical protein